MYSSDGHCYNPKSKNELLSNSLTSLAVSLGYLRNLEVPMLKVEDMPALCKL